MGGVANWRKKEMAVIEGRGKTSQGFYVKLMRRNLLLSHIHLAK